MAHRFLRADYPAKTVQEAFSRAYHKDRALLLNPSPRVQEEDTTNIFLITTYHPGGRILGDIVNSHSPLWVHIGAGSWSRGFVSQIFLRLIFSETSISQGQKPKKSAYKVFRQIFYSSLKFRLSKFQRTTQNMTFI